MLTVMFRNNRKLLRMKGPKGMSRTYPRLDLVQCFLSVTVNQRTYSNPSLLLHES